jgi:type IV pilus assembly protein PilB
MSKIRLGDMLLKAGVIHEFQLNSALSFQRQLGGRLGASLIRLGYLDEDTLLNFLADQMDLSRIDLDAASISDDIIKLVPVDKALEFSVVPFGLKEVGGVKQLFVAMSDPTNLVAVDELKFISGYQIRPAIAAEDAVIRSIKRYYGIDVPGSDAPAVAAKPGKQAKAPADVSGFGLTTEEKLKVLVKILIEKKVLDKADLERFKV